MDQGESDTQRLGNIDDAVTEVERSVRQAPSKRFVRRIAERSALLSRIAVLASLLIALAAMSLSAYLAIQVGKTSAEVALAQDSLDSLRATNAKLREQGLPEIPEPAPGETLSADAIVASLLTALRAEIQNDPQFKGSEGDAGRPGKDGEGGDPGKEGKPGSDGPGGQDGENGRDGRDGRPPTQDELLETVKLYCSGTARCEGAPGKDGVDGKPGVQGVSVVDVRVEGCDFVFTLVDPQTGNQHEDRVAIPNCTSVP